MNGRPDGPVASNEMRRDEGRLRENRRLTDGRSLGQFRARGWTGAILVALFGGIAALVPYYSRLVLLLTVAATIATLLAWLLISVRSRRYTPRLSVLLNSLVFIFVAFALLSVSVGANRPGSGLGAVLLGLAVVTFAAAAVVGWLRPSRQLHEGALFGAVLAAGLCLAVFLKFLPQDFVARYLAAIVGLVIIAVTGYSWLGFVKRWRTRATNGALKPTA